MEQNELRTYHSRSVTRESGYHTCDDTTGGECLVKFADRYICQKHVESFSFHRDSIELVELFENGISTIAFGGFIFSNKKATISFEIGYTYEGNRYEFTDCLPEYEIEEKSWKNVGFHIEQTLNVASAISDISIIMRIISVHGNILDFISFDFDVISKDEFLDMSCSKSFYQKTAMHIPYLYYLRTDLPFNEYLQENYTFSRGKRIILKSCNRCGRYLPINIDDEIKTLAFSLHCKKRAPCVHSTFRSYQIQNLDELSSEDLDGLTTEDNKVISYFGHQLECKACKKFFVNAPLNPQRNPQQFKEDGLRRRALEVLVNTLLEKNLIHFEYEHRTNREFSEYIWNKFNRRCFKCGPSSKPLAFGEMALDHTLPLAYLYRLDETATCLCSSHNSQKRDSFPVDYYTPDELERLSDITGMSMEQLQTRSINQDVLNLLVEHIVWFYDEFLMNEDYQKIRDGILTADKINDSLKRVIAGQVDLAEEYKSRTGHYPTSVTTR